jgi:ElaB/YqjD/DUF883 family membrane-anchored ribosome-binding protein
MTDKDIRSEIEELRAQLESLSRTAGQQDASSSAAGATPRREGDAEDDAASGWFRDIIKQAEELMGGLDLQLKDVPAKTALLIFALGILTGRLLSRKE